MQGYVHSIESFGTVDGPGVRLVVFLQGCPMRCRYCHNPDTWQTGVGELISAEEILERFDRNKEFYKNGGITVTGGEPLLQIEFLTDLFRKAKDRGIHLCLDTSGATYSNSKREVYIKLLSLVDLVLLDIKHIDSDKHKSLTGMDNAAVLDFAKLLCELSVPVWIRHVTVPGVTDDVDSLSQLGEFIATLDNVRVLDVLPYHTLGRMKYENLGIPYSLDGVRQATDADTEFAKKHILLAYKRAKNKK